MASSTSQSPASSNITMNSEASIMQEQQNLQQQQPQQQLWQLHQSKQQLLNANSQYFNIHGSLMHHPSLYNSIDHHLLQHSSTSNTSSCTSSSFHGSPASASLVDPPNSWEAAMVSASNSISSGSNYINENDNHLNGYNQQLAMAAAAMAMASSVPSHGSSPPSSSCLSEVEQKPVVLNPNSATTSTGNSSGNTAINPSPNPNPNPNSLSNAMINAMTVAPNSVSNAMASNSVMNNVMNNSMANSITNPMVNPANSVSAAATLNPNQQQLWLPAAAAAIPPSFGHGASAAAFNLANLISADPAFAERAAKFSSYTQGLMNPLFNQLPLNTKNDMINAQPVQSAAANNPVQLNNNHNTNNNNKTQINSSAKSINNVNNNNNSVPANGAIKAPPAAPPENKSPPPESKKRKTPTPTPKGSENSEEAKKAKTGKNGDKISGENKAQSSNSGNSGSESEQKTGKEVSKPDPSPAPKPDYIHVRARRGQATDSHSLAERVRREKISERMKYLQDLVPGCSKVTGKAMMLDEIINYVQSLQRQVEFLSMKLAAVHPAKMDFSFESLMNKEVMQPAVINNHVGFGAQETAINPLYAFNFSDNLHLQGVNPGFQLAANPQAQGQLTDHNPLGECISQIGGPWDDELQNMVQMVFPQNPLMVSNLNGSMFHGQMKAEL